MSSARPSTVFYLEMNDRAHFQPSATREGLTLNLVDPSDPEINRRFYAAVGAQWEWHDRLDWSDGDWESQVNRDELKTFIGRLHGEEIGYVELETQETGDVEIVYFGLLPDFIGKGLGGAFLSAAIESAWDLPTTKRIWLHTCTFDHENALKNYQARGFQLYKTEE